MSNVIGAQKWFGIFESDLVVKVRYAWLYTWKLVGKCKILQ